MYPPTLCTDHHGNNSVDNNDSQLYNIQSIKNFVITQYTTVAQLIHKSDCGAVESTSTDEHVMNLVFFIQWVESDSHVA